ncbi:MAG: glycosyltransferase [Candidatus Eisenbacteria bacterium]
MRKALLIAYHFPPLTTSGMYRSLQFARHLPEHDWESVVLTVRPETIHAPGFLDSEPLSSLGPGTRVVRTRAFEPLQSLLHARDRFSKRLRPTRAAEGTNHEAPNGARTGWRDWVSDLFSVPDRQAGWVPGAFSAALRLIEEEEISVLYSSSPPASGHIAAFLAARFSGCPWVADFRDPWVANRFAPARSVVCLSPLDCLLEEMVLAGADRVITNTEELRDVFLGRYPDLARKFVTISNGYDPDEEIPRPAPGSTRGPFTITHAGSLYGPREPSALLKAVSGLLERGAVAPDRLRILFVGSVSGGERWRDLLDSPLLSRVVRVLPKVPRAEALRLLAESDLLLLIQTGTDVQIPRKVYEYMAVGRPILALVTGGATESLVRRENAGWVVHPDDPAGIERTLLAAIGGAPAPRPPHPERYDFRRLTGMLARVLEEVSS